jgi:hypothetical protein
MELPDPDDSFAGVPCSSPESMSADVKRKLVVVIKDFHTGMFSPFVLLHQIADFFIAGIPEIGIIDRATPVNVHHTPINPFRQ